MDLNNFQKINKANTSTITFRKKQDFVLKFNVKQERFTFSEETWQELGLDNNSLIQFNNYTGEDTGMYLQIVPGNTGVFLRKHGNGSKGRNFKNTEMISALQQLNTDPYEIIYFDIESIGIVGEFPMFKVNVDADRHQRLVVDVANVVEEPQVNESHAIDAMVADINDVLAEELNEMSEESVEERIPDSEA